MNDMLQETLAIKYPTLFNADHWTMPTNSINVGDGWFAAIDRALPALEEMADKYQRNSASNVIICSSLVEREGRLAFSLNYYPKGTQDPAFKVIEALIKEVQTICRKCGEPGRMMTGDGVIFLNRVFGVLCKPCHFEATHYKLNLEDELAEEEVLAAEPRMEEPEEEEAPLNL